MKAGLKKFVIWAMVVVSLAGTLSLSVGMRQVMAVSVSEAVAQMKEAAQVQLVANVFSKCVKMQRDKGDYPGGFSRIIPNMFNYQTGGLGQNKEVPTGAWLENQVQGKVNNGTIYCNDNDANLINVFASTMGISVEQVVCNGNQPGILKARVNGEDVDGECAAGISAEGVTFVWNDASSANTYLKKLYDNKLKDNPYKVNWDDRGTFTDDLVNYYLYLSDFETACSTNKYSGNPKLMDKSRYFPALKMPDAATGELKDVYYSKSNIVEDNWDSNWINDDGPHTCEAVIERMNKAAPAVQKALNEITKAEKEAVKSQCRTSYENKAAERIKALNEQLAAATSDEEKKKIKDALDTINRAVNEVMMGGSEDYWQAKADGSIVCMNPPYTEGSPDDPVYTPPTDTGADSGLSGTGDTEEQASPCSTAAASLGWIICPVIQGVGTATNGIYSYLENSYLQTNASFMTSNSDTHGAWEKFRDMANLVFVVALLIIILSQITGFGVTNYGIKKMLPSLIMVAVLVNLSFFLCQVAVDLSNIVGYDVKQVFSNLGTTPEDFGDGGIGGIIGDPSGSSGILPTILTGATGIAAAGALIASAGTWIWPFLLVLLGAAISIIFFFILLGVRQAAIIILVALAPIAIICYALPNTKSIFSRWWKIFFGMLIVYPICGALMGGGQFASRLLLGNISNDSSGAFFYVLVAMLVQAVPFFFVPSIVKSSFAAIGNLGMKLSNFGRGLSRATTGTIRKSEGYKDQVAGGKAWDAGRAIRRSEKTTGLRGGINRIGKWARGGEDGPKNRVSRALNNSYNRKQNRLQSAVLAQNLANRDRSQAFAQRHMNELAQDFTDTWSNDGTFASDEKAAEQLEVALDDLRTDSTNVDARARFASAMRRLNTGDEGRARVYSAINKAEMNSAQNGIMNNKGIQWAAGTVMNEAGGEYKAKSPAAFKNLNSLAAGRAFDASKIKEVKVNDGLNAYINTDYQNAKMDGIGAEQLANTDDIYRSGAIQGLEDGSITGDKRNNLIAQAREAINNPNISVKGDVERDLQQIANMDYAPPMGSASSNSSVNTVDGASVRSMANANQSELDRIVRGIENGSIRNDAEHNINDRTEIANVAEATLNAANAGTVTLSQETADKLNRVRALDGRAEIPYSLRVSHNPNAAPIPGGYEENGSGIIIPRNGHGDLSGSQVRDFERQMRQHNNNGGGNNQNGGGPTIIRP